MNVATTNSLFPGSMFRTCKVHRSLAIDCPPNPERLGPVVVFVEGNIAAGKSSFLKRLAETTKLTHAITEPIRAWQNLMMLDRDLQRVEETCNVLDEFYRRGPGAMGVNLQLTVVASMLRTAVIADELPRATEIVLFERSIASSERIFFTLAAPSIPRLDRSVMQCLYNELPAVLPGMYAPDIICYIDTPPEICFERMRARDRGEEDQIGRSYIDAIQEKYREWRQDRYAPLCPVHRDLVIFGDQPVDDMVDSFFDQLGGPERTLDFLRKTSDD